MRRILLALLMITGLLSFSQLADAQSISRDVCASAGETLSTGNTSITFVLGETVADLFFNNTENKFLTVGFSQPDVELRQLLETHPKKPFIAYPNPTTSGVVKLAFNDLPDATYTIEVLDAAGRVLQTQTTNYSRNSFLYFPLDLTAYAKGIYFVRVKNGLTVSGQVKVVML